MNALLAETLIDQDLSHHHNFEQSEADTSLIMVTNLIVGGIAQHVRTDHGYAIAPIPRYVRVKGLRGKAKANEEQKATAVNNLVGAVNAFLKLTTDNSVKVIDELEKSGIEEISESALILTQRFLKKRSDFMAHHSLLNAKEFVKALGVTDSNPSRYMNRMRENNMVLAVKINENYSYPAFQLDKEASVYTELVQSIPKLSKYMSGWDISFWLTEMHTITQYMSVPDFDVVEQKAKTITSLDDITAFIDDNADSSGVVSATPLSLLEGGETDLFDEFVDSMITDEKEIPLKVISASTEG
ncbi:hypothetical protein PVK63_14445 [Aliivibrio sp. S2TY2]|uniref:hypothetical protein n=1 Tax=unclassified Aliivibrio TaxID=2645654 RepID=UPI002378F3F4|nr:MULTISPECIES: hypothetical protein [unclassified Aliivibrio]MDD9175940.1 hypothetical protein [Aliivibrio sp. S3TY1]MDD9193145.1 hypothetical protein [Aliivibrio sp. S2TY2]